MRPTQLPRLLWRKSHKGRKAHWTILYRRREYATKFGEGQREDADIELKKFTRRILKEHESRGSKPGKSVTITVANEDGQPEQQQLHFGHGGADEVAIGNCLAYYAFKKASSTGRAVSLESEIKNTSAFCGNWKVAKVNGETFFDEYAAWRCAQRDARAKHGPGKPISITTAKREIISLIAALNMSAKHGLLERAPVITLPSNIDVVNDRFLSRPELVKLLWAALGWDLRGRKPKRNRFRINYHVARFILIGYRTGTRHDAILHLGWMPSTEGGWFDLQAGTMHRRGLRVRDTNKRRPATRIPAKLMRHLERWRRLTTQYVIEHEGQPLAGQLRRAFEGAVLLSGIRSPDAYGQKITPHILKHTCITHRLQQGQPIRDVAAFTGTSEETIRKKYSHHAAAEMGNIADFGT